MFNISSNEEKEMADNKLQSLTEIFNQKFFRIPDFQRGYLWGKKELEDFWDDIQNLKNERIHYTGLLTVEPINRTAVNSDDSWLLESGFSAYYIIDGQQRLTTAIIFINQFLKKIDETGKINFREKKYWIEKFLYMEYQSSYKSYIFGYEIDNPSDEYFKTKVLEQKSSGADRVPEQTLYTANLEYARNFFDSKLLDFKIEELDDLFKKLVNKLKFNFYEIDDELDIYVTFETMNNRGKSLSKLELLKNRLIYLSTIFEGDKGVKIRLRKDINDSWKTIYEYLGKNKDNQLEDDDFLYNHWIMYFQYNRKESASHAKFLLNEKFTTKNVLSGKLKIEEIKDYIDSLSKSAKSWFYLFNIEFSSYSKDETKEWFQKLERIGMSAFPPLFMAAMVKNEPEENLVKLLKSSERFKFLVFSLSQRPTNTQNSHFYRLAYLYYNGEKTLSTIIDEIDYISIGKKKEGNEIIYEGWFDLKKFQSYIDELFKKDQGYYSWNGIRYFLYEYELYLQAKAKGNEKVSWLDFNKRKKEDTIEHIYPQTPKEQYWLDLFDDLKTSKDKNCYLHSLGNLVLLSRSKNSELQNKNFDFKKKHQHNNGHEVGFFNGSYSEISVASYEKWSPIEIMDRGNKMLDFMQERWQFKIEDWEITKNNLLNVD